MNRILRTSSLILIGLSLLAGPLFAESPRIAVTVYNNDLGLVRERRALALERGESVYEYRDVAERIDPTSVHFRPVDGKGGLEVLEQNYEYDLVSSDKVFQKYLEHPVQVFFDKSGDMLSGVLLSHGRGGMVLRDAAGERLFVLLGDVRNVELLGEAKDFVTRPTLVWKLRSERAGEREVEVEYLTRGISWHAEYVALADEPNRFVDFAGWVSVENNSGAEYRDAKLKLVAGDVGRAAPEPRYDYVLTETRAAKGAPMVEERALFEYHLYDVQRPTTIRKNEVKQISFVPNTKVAIAKEYLYDTRKNQEKVAVHFEFLNDEKSGLGIPLPAGIVRVFQDDGRGGSEFVGEDRVDHTPKEEKVRLRIGYAFDIAAEKKILSEERRTERLRVRTVEIRLRNRKEEAIEVKVWEGIEGDWTIERETHPSRREDAHTAEWVLPVGKNEETVLTYTVRIQY
ncbi:MAG: DUF4139 domain-containing protein [Candidatus Eisenbacteria bacterium]|nr:DUF4139 domain-containing protein [Candidatus Eisenbacteria bacterium]